MDDAEIRSQALAYLAAARIERNGTTHSWETLQRAAALAAEDAAYWLSRTLDAAEPVAYLVAEQREGRWIIGDDWSPEFSELGEAQARAESWRALPRHADGADDDVAVLALTVVPRNLTAHDASLATLSAAAWKLLEERARRALFAAFFGGRS